MVIKINGIEESVEAVFSIAQIVSKKKLTPEHIVIEHNFRIVPKEEWDSVTLRENDNIEIISFVGGG